MNILVVAYKGLFLYVLFCFFYVLDIDQGNTGKASSAFELFDVLLFVVSSVTLSVMYF